ncbi:MAG: tetratricopeptide repeat protein [Gammaproteobacteria bacterium]|nr:tetratricopeptide repeat protein [Gammaproteobacteria bacterium]
MADLREKVKALDKKAEALFAKKKWEEGIHICTQAVDLADQDASIPDYLKASLYNNRGVAYGHTGAYDRAVNDYTKALELNPKLFLAYTNRGDAYSNKRDYDRAIADHNKALEIQPDYAPAYLNRGNAYCGKTDLDRAIADYTKALEIDSSIPLAHSHRGHAYYDKGEYDQAIADYDTALKLNPNDERTIRYRALAITLKASRTEQERIHQQYQKEFKEQLAKQREQFDAELEEYRADLLHRDEYKARHKEFHERAEEVRGNMQKWLGVLRWIAGGFLALVLLCMGYTFWKGPGIWPIFPLITAAAGLCAFPFIWQIRTLEKEEARLMALSQDAYTKGILANLINVNLDPAIRKELLNKFFDHHAEHGSAQLIIDLENNGKSESGAVNVLIKYLKDNMSGKN